MKDRKNDFQWPEQLRKKYRRKFKKGITATEIKKIWKAWLKEIIKEVVAGECVKLDSHSTLRVVGVESWKDKRFYALISKGKAIRNGKVVNARLSPVRKMIKYKIEYTNDLVKTPLYFRAAFSGKVHKALTETATYYPLK